MEEVEPKILLEVRALVTAFDTDAGQLTAVDGVSFGVRRGRTLGIVGESGCGKSVTAMSIMRLLPQPMGKILGGEVLFDGRNLATVPAEDMRTIRGNRISMIFQEPMTALNPVHRIGKQICEVLTQHNDLSPDDEDCDPSDPSVYPGAEELCDGKDNDCDGTTDPDDTVTTSPCRYFHSRVLKLSLLVPKKCT